MSVARLVAHENPEGRATPILLLADLRSIDPTVELVYFGSRDWRLGAVRPDGPAREERAKRGERMLAELSNAKGMGYKVSPKSFMLGHLLKQGFAQIAQYFDFGDVSGTVKDAWDNETTIIHDFRERDAHWRRDQGESVVRQAAAEASTNKPADERALSHYLATEGRAHYRREVRGRFQFGYGGMTGGTGQKLVRGVRHKPIITGREVMEDIESIMAELSAG